MGDNPENERMPEVKQALEALKDCLLYTSIPNLLAFIGTQPEWKDKVRAKAAPTRRSVDDGKVVRCDNTEGVLPVFRLKAGRTLSDDEIKDRLTEGHTKLLKGFKSKQGKSFDAVSYTHLQRNR